MSDQNKNEDLKLLIYAAYHDSLRMDWKPSLRDITAALKKLIKNPEGITSTRNILGDRILLELSQSDCNGVGECNMITASEFEKLDFADPLRKPLTAKELQNIQRNALVLLERIECKSYPFDEIDIPFYFLFGKGIPPLKRTKTANRYCLRIFIHLVIKILLTYGVTDRNVILESVAKIAELASLKSIHPHFSVNGDINKHRNIIAELVENEFGNHFKR